MIRLWPITQLHLETVPPPAEDPSLIPQIESHWRSMLAASPRLHDGRIVRVLACEPPTLRVAFDTYKRFAVGAVVPTGVLALGISGVVTRRRNDRDEILLGRRSPQTRIYGDLCETAPRGGVDASPTATELTLSDIIRQFHEELHEETGIVATATPRPIAVVLDEFARTYDVILRVEVPADTEAAPREWEYTQTAWKTLPEARETDTLSPPTRSLIDWIAAPSPT
ncbi:MAG: hypothetical protein ACK58T_08660 [Phycisphaerae bacterium]